MNTSRSIDTVYEFFGYQAVASLRGAFWSLGLFAIVAVAGLLWIFHQAAQKNDGRLAWNYLLQLMFAVICFLPIEIDVGPREFRPNPHTGDTKQHRVSAPLVLAVVHRLMDSTARVLTSDGDSVFLGSAFEWERIVAATESARIHDPALSARFHAYLKHCYWRAIANLRAAGHHPVQEASDLEGAKPLREHEFFVEMMRRPTWDSEGANCADERVALLTALRAHVEADVTHSALLDDVMAKQANTPGITLSRLQFEEIYLFRMIDNEARGLDRDTEVALLSRAVPGYSLADQKFDVAPAHEAGPLDIAEAVVGKGSTTLAMVDEWFSKYSKAPVAYYRFSLWAPYIYGFVTCFLLTLFPFAMLWSLWPGNWMALVNFLKVFVSIKCVPVLWSWASAINSARFALSPTDGDGSRGTGDAYHWFPGLVAIYLAAPLLSYWVVAGVTRAAMNVGSQVFGPSLASGGGNAQFGGIARGVSQQAMGAAVKVGASWPAGPSSRP